MVAEPRPGTLRSMNSPVDASDALLARPEVASRVRRRLPPLTVRSGLRVALWVLLVGAVVIAPPFVTRYQLNLLVTLAITALPVLSLTLLFGFAGQVSLGQAAFYGFGAYTYAYLQVRRGVSPWVALPVAILFNALLAWVIGRGLFRLRGYYLAMVTAALGVIAASFFGQATDLTGGYSGINNIQPPSLFGFQLDSNLKFYYVVVIIVALVFVLMRRLSSGEYGRRLRTMKESEVAAAAFGIDVPALKSQVFALSAGVAALGGALFSQYVGYISPNSFAPDVSITYFLGAVVGGLGSVWGALLGAAYAVLLPELVTGHGRFEIAITGAITVVVISFSPGGLVGLIAAGVERLHRRSEVREGAN